jgi:hypothetical protein
MPQVSITLLDGRDPLTEDLASRHAAAWGHFYTNWDNSKALAMDFVQLEGGPAA